MAIHSEKEFIETFKEGDIFYYLLSWYGKPLAISWPIKIKAIIFNHPEDIREKLIRIIADNSEYDEWHYVSDLTNQYHGVCKTEKEATDYLQTRLAEFASNPELQQEYQFNLELNEMFDYFDDSDY